MNKTYFYVLLSVLLGTATIITSCQRDEEVVVSTLMTKEPVSIGARVASIGFQMDYKGTITNCGVCYSQSPEPTLEDAVVEYGDSLPNVCLLIDLEPETRYYARSFIQNSTDILYGNEVVFTTTAPLMSSGHEYVDLGLSVMWATCNVGADYPEDYGHYFSWGEIVPKNEYMWENYKYGSSPTDILKYNNISTKYGAMDYNSVLDLWDDAAYMNWGGDWRMPTREEVEELIYCTTWKWETQNGVRGCLVTSKLNGNSIFFPATGYYRDSELLDERINVGIWTSTLWKNGASWGTGMAINSTDTTTNVPQFHGFMRYNGDPVRPVLGKEITPPVLGVPTVTTDSMPAEIGPDYIRVTYDIHSDNGSMPTEFGLCYSTNPNVTINDSKKISSYLGLGGYVYSLTNLQEGTTYYIRAYAINKYGVGYGEEIAVTTSTRLYENGYEYVDLGLSVKWATMNVGATSPEGYGDYFAWGETEPKEVYDWSTYKWCEGTYNSQIKYNNNSSYGRVDNKTTLELSDDAARANWGGSWRMPTDAELTELQEQCTWTWTTLNGVNGNKITSKRNYRSIFLPAAGLRYENSLYYVGISGYYWSSLLIADNSYDAWRVYFNASYAGGYRNSGLSVRPVCP